jgi:hypothetical protein
MRRRWARARVVAGSSRGTYLSVIRNKHPRKSSQSRWRQVRDGPWVTLGLDGGGRIGVTIWRILGGGTGAGALQREEGKAEQALRVVEFGLGWDSYDDLRRAPNLATHA